MNNLAIHSYTTIMRLKTNSAVSANFNLQQMAEAFDVEPTLMKSVLTANVTLEIIKNALADVGGEHSHPLIDKSLRTKFFEAIVQLSEQED